MLDPPYRFKASGGGAYRASRANLDMVQAEGLDKGFDLRIINPLLCGAAVVFSHNDQLPELLPHLAGSFVRFAVCEWLKPCPTPMRNKHYLPDQEFYTHAWHRGFHPVGEHHDMHRHITCRPRQSKEFGHGTVKPDAVMDKIVRNVAGSTICDPFMGTGSTGVAAIKAGRTFTGIEHNPRHFETAVRRLTEAWETRQLAAAA